MDIIQKIDNASERYATATLKRALALTDDTIRPRDKQMPIFDAYALDSAFFEGALFALSNQWISVEEELPPFDGRLLLCRDCENFALCEWDGESFYDAYNDFKYRPTHWIPEQKGGEK